MEDGLRVVLEYIYLRKLLLVLILVLMEDGLRDYRNIKEIIIYFVVLILVLMEDGLREKRRISQRIKRNSLNPCFNGRWSART